MHIVSICGTLIFLLVSANSQTEKDLIIYCSDNCFDYLNGQIKDHQLKQLNKLCDVKENVPTPWKTQIPGPKADLQNVHWYVKEHKPGDRRLAINITWSEKGYWDGPKLQNGYLLQIVPSESVLVKYNVIVRARNHPYHGIRGKKQYQKVYFNYKCYGLSEETFVSPGKTYLIVLKTLPVSPSNLDHLFDTSIVTMPDCSDKTVKETRNCQFPELEWGTAATTTVKQTTNLPTAVFQCCPDVLLYFLLALGACILVGVLFLIYIIPKQYMPKGFPLNKSVLLLADNTDGNRLVIRAGDEVARSMMILVKNVTYSIWHSTKISQTGMVEWLSDNCANVNCLVVLCSKHCCPEADNRNDDLDEKHSLTSDRSVANWIYDNRTFLPKIYSLHYNTDSSVCTLTKDVFEFPEECTNLLEKIVGRKLPKSCISNFKKRFNSL